MEALQREYEVAKQERAARDMRQRQEVDKKNRETEAMEELQRKQEQSVRSKLPQGPSAIEQARQQQQLQQQRQQNINKWLNAMGQGLAFGVGTYYATPKNTQSAPRPSIHKAPKTPKPAPAPTRGGSSLPGQVMREGTVAPRQ
jgi:hypothetical protein